MDELLQMLTQVHRRLGAFNETLQAAAGNLEDEFRALPPGVCSPSELKQVEQVLEGFASYLSTTGPRTEEYIERIIRLLKLYLYE